MFISYQERPLPPPPPPAPPQKKKEPQHPQSESGSRQRPPQPSACLKAPKHPRSVLEALKKLFWSLVAAPKASRSLFRVSQPCLEPRRTSGALKPFQLLCAFIYILYKQDSGLTFSARGAGGGGGSNNVLGIGFCNNAGDSTYEVDIKDLKDPSN